MHRFLPFIIVAIVGLGALTGGVLLYRAKRPPVSTLSPDQMTAAGKGEDAAHARGNPGAPVVLEEFGDMQCPPCGALSDPVNQLVKDYPGRVRIVFRHFPLSTHAYAHQAALALEAAGLQGQFWGMHDLLYREQSTWSNAPEARSIFEAFAGTLGLDLARFKRDMDGEQAKAGVAGDEKRGVKLGVSTTPTIFVNGREVPRDSLRPDRLHALVDAAVKSSPVPQNHG